MGNKPPPPPPEYVTSVPYQFFFVGDFGVGKTSLVHRIAYNKFGGPPDPSLDVDYHTASTTIDKQVIKLGLNDTHGQEKDQKLTADSWSSADIIWFVFDLHNKSSFESLKTWMGEYYTNRRNDHGVPILICNKSENGVDDSVSPEEVRAFVTEFQLKEMYKVSAKTSNGVEKALHGSLELFAKVPYVPLKFNNGRPLSDSKAPGNVKKSK